MGDLFVMTRFFLERKGDIGCWPQRKWPTSTALLLSGAMKLLRPFVIRSLHFSLKLVTMF